MIERWFPCAEVSQASYRGWGSGNSEAILFPWFAKRPLAQARAAVLTSLLPWPDEPAEQIRLQELVRLAMKDYNRAHSAVCNELRALGADVSMLDPFSGRAMFPLEGGRYGVRAFGIEYSQVATLGGQLLADYPMRDWDKEPELHFGVGAENLAAVRLLSDVERTLKEVGIRYAAQAADLYPTVNGRQPWGYLWAVTLPCQECGRRFPLVGSLALRPPNLAKGDPGQSFDIQADCQSDGWKVVVHSGPPTGQPTRVLTGGKSKYSSSGKVAVCPFCEHVHPKDVHTRLARDRQGADAPLLAADIDELVGKTYRNLTDEEVTVTLKAGSLLEDEKAFSNGLSAAPDEAIPAGNTWTIQATVYGIRTYGEMCNKRQTVTFIRLARIIADLSSEMSDAGLSPDYMRALSGYASAVLVRKLRRATRGCTLDASRNGVHDIFFSTESSLNYSYDYFEVGLGDGPGTWNSVAEGTVAALRRQMGRSGGRPAVIERGSALSLRHRSGSMTAVVTDPPYDAMIDYCDASDLFYVWLKRAMSVAAPDLAFTSDAHGLQEKSDEIIVKKGRTSNNDFRTQERYDGLIADAFTEARRVVRTDGVVTIVFGHGDPEVWHRLLGAITKAGLVLTASWPAKTEKGGKAGSSNIVTTLTMACRPAPARRPTGRANLVDSEVRQEVRTRIPQWEAGGLAPTDQLMASAGPAMEAVGRYEQVLNHLGNPVDPAHYLVVARRAVEQAAAVVIDHLPLETFDVRTRFALSWARLYRRSAAAKSEARWQALAADLSSNDLKGILREADKGVRLSYAKDWNGTLTESSSVIDVAMAMAKAWPDGLDSVAEVLVATGRDTADNYLWAAIGYLSSLLPEADPDAMAWTSLLRGRAGIGAVTRGVVSARRKAANLQEATDQQASLFDMSRQDSPRVMPEEPHRNDANRVITEEPR